MYRLAFFLLPIFFITACEQISFQEETIPVDELRDIPAPLIIHFRAFEVAAEDRGIFIDWSKSGITAELRQLQQESVAGVCSTNSHGLRHIAIDLDFWQRASHLNREMIVFHELGHCILGQGHREESFSNGICKSIMRSGTGMCRDAYRIDTRSYFLDELFEVKPSM